jgi:hypothetical protein
MTSIPPTAAPEEPTTVVSFTEAQLIERVELARKEEKAKLYNEIQLTNQKLATQDQSLAQLNQIQAELASAQQRLATLDKARTPTGEIDVKQLIADTAAAVESKKNTEINELRSRLDGMEKTAKQAKLDALRIQLVSEAKGRIISAMVVGDNEDSLRASAENAKAEYEAIVTAHATSPASNPPAPQPPPPLNARQAAGGGTPPQGGLDGFVRTRDPAAFAVKRNQLMDSLKLRYS